MNMNVEKAILLTGIILTARAAGDAVDAEVATYLNENYPDATFLAVMALVGEASETIKNPNSVTADNPLFAVIDNLLKD